MIAGNKKWGSYVLGAVVLVIWAVVIYRIVMNFFAEEGKEEVQSRELGSSSAPPPGDNAPDTFSLRLDYQDPFLKDAPRRKRRRPTEDREEEERKKVHKEKKVRTEEKPPPWPNIEFGGLVRNRSSERVVALLKIDGNKRLMSEGDERDSISLERVWTDSVRVALGGRERVIAKR